MRRSIARGQTWWVRLFILMVLVNALAPIPRPWDLASMLVPLLLFAVRPPAATREPVLLDAPVRGRWVACNSPGSAVPSHRVRAHGQMYAVDVVRPSADGRPSLGWSLRGRRPESYPSFGEPVLAMAPGKVVHLADRQRDHRARDSWPSLLWMMSLEGFLRVLGGAPRILGNHVIVRHDDGTVAAYAHLRHGSASVRVGEAVQTGQELGQVGNTGNTSEPHLHVQLMDRQRPESAAGLPMLWSGVQLVPDGIDTRWATGPAKASAQPGVPANGQVFEVRPRQTHPREMHPQHIG